MGFLLLTLGAIEYIIIILFSKEISMSVKLDSNIKWYGVTTETTYKFSPFDGEGRRVKYIILEMMLSDGRLVTHKIETNDLSFWTEENIILWLNANYNRRSAYNIIAGRGLLFFMTFVNVLILFVNITLYDMHSSTTEPVPDDDIEFYYRSGVILGIDD